MQSILNTIFEEVYVINLDSRQDKMEHFIKEASKINLQYQRFSAITPFILRNTHIDKCTRIACMESHRSIWRDCQNRNVKSVLIFEDDVIIDKNFNELFESYYKAIPNDWNIMNLCFNKTGYLFSRNLMELSTINEFWYAYKKLSGMICYGLKNEIFQDIISMLNDNERKEHFDLLLSQLKFYEKPNVKSYAINNDLMIFKTIGDSDIK